MFNSNSRSLVAWSSELEDQDCRTDNYPSLITSIVREQLQKFNLHKSMRLGKIHSRVLKKSVDIQLTILKGHGNLGSGSWQILYPSTKRAQEYKKLWSCESNLIN